MIRSPARFPPPRAPPVGCSAGGARDIAHGRPLISWYPGHIAKAERNLGEVLKLVDVVVELRDARIPLATSHPDLPGWVGKRGHVLAVNRIDAVPPVALQEWTRALGSEREPLLVDARTGAGVPELKRAIRDAGAKVNERRKRRGLKPRAVRAAILGFPNVGKSALLNRLVGRVKTKSENRPGVTRGFTWVAIDKEVQLLDSPGIIPAKQVEPSVAYLLAMCNDIGEASYDTRSVAAALAERLLEVATARRSFARLDALEARYGVGLTACSGEEYLEALAAARFTGDRERTATALLRDFQAGRLGSVCLELPPPQAAAWVIAPRRAGVPQARAEEPEMIALRVLGLGRYGGAPAVFLGKPEDRGEPQSRVLPVPVPPAAEKALEMALGTLDQGTGPGRRLVERDGGAFDNAPWGWAPSGAKREVLARFSGRLSASPYRVLLDALPGRAVGVRVELADLLGDLVLGGTLVLAREDGGAVAEVECTTDEAVGFALALGQLLPVERAVWDAAALPAAYSLQRGKMRIAVDAPAEAVPTSEPGPLVPLPWEIRSIDELLAMSVEDLARSALRAGLQPPRARRATAAVLQDLLAPVLDEDVRRQVNMRRALDAGDFTGLAALDAGVSQRGQLLAQLRAAAEDERFAEAAGLAQELRIATDRRQDVTQDEGAYDLSLDQDDWYARDLARARERELERERRLAEGNA